MNKHQTLITVGFTNLIIGLFIGIASTAAYVTVFVRNDIPHVAASDMRLLQQTQVAAVLGTLESKTDDDFDKIFLKEMILHREAGIQMAELALQNAKHMQLKQLAQDIISNHTHEIEHMYDWQKSWYNY
jgi:uncharacterized protein (DUF305 family)